MLVPSWFSWAKRLDWLERVMPRMPTIAPTPMAMPRPDRVARSRRLRSPSVPTLSRSPARNRDSAGVLGMWVRLAGVGDDPAVADFDPAAAGGGDRGVMGDDHDRDALVVQLAEQPDHGGAVGRVEVAR